MRVNYQKYVLEEGWDKDTGQKRSAFYDSAQN